MASMRATAATSASDDPASRARPRDVLHAAERAYVLREEQLEELGDHIHATTLQSLAVALRTCRVAATVRGSEPDAARAHLATTENMVVEAIAALRHAVTELRRGKVAQIGLEPAARAYLDNVSTLWGREIAFHSTIERPPPAAVATHAMAIIERVVEALVHGDAARRLEVRLAQRGASVGVTVAGAWADARPARDAAVEELLPEIRATMRNVGGSVLFDRSASAIELGFVVPGGIGE